MDVFVEWALHHDANISKIVFDVIDGMRGGKTTKSIQEDEDILSVPCYLLITMDVIHKSYIKSLVECLTQPPKDVWALFYLYIVRETYCDTSKDPREYKVVSNTGEEINFKPYFQMLPKIIGTPLSWSQNELNELKGSNLYDAVTTIAKSLRNTYDSLMPQLFDKYPQIFDKSIFTWNNFVWAYEIFWSRALSIEAPWINIKDKHYLQSKHVLSQRNADDDEEDEEENAEKKEGTEVNRIAALVPVIDLLNHSPSSKVTYFTDVKTQRFSLRSRDTIIEGVQAFNNYGLRNNEKLLLNYGFLLENNNVDYFYLKLGWNIADVNLKNRLVKLLKDKNIKSQHYLIRGNKPVDDRLIEAMRIRLLSESEYYIYISNEQHQINYTSFVSAAFSIPNEYQALKLLHNMLHHRMCKFETTIEEDQILLTKAIDFTENKIKAIKYRLGQKEILRSSMMFIQELQQSLYTYSQSISNVNPTKTVASSLRDYNITSNNNLNLCEIENGLLYLTTADIVTKSSELYSIKSEYLLNENTLMTEDIISCFKSETVTSLKELFSNYVSEELLLTYLIMENKSNYNSKWGHYFKEIDQQLTTTSPLLYNEEELNELEGTNAINMITDILQEYSEECSQLLLFIKEFGVYKEEVHNWNTFLKSRIIVDCYSDRIKGTNSILSIIPLIQSPIQHPNIPLPLSMFYDKETTLLTCSSILPISKNQCIPFTRENDIFLDNSSIFCFTSCVIENNPLDVYSLTIELPSDKYSSTRRFIIENEGFQVEQHFLSEGVVPVGLLFALKIFYMDSKELSDIKLKNKNEMEAFKKSLVKDEELVEQVIQLLESLLSTFTTTLEADNLSYTNLEQLPFKIRSILKYRRQQKIIIVSTINQLKK